MWVIVVLASLAALIVFVFCVPLDLVLRLDVYGRPKFCMRLAWFFGLVSREVGKRPKNLKEKKQVVKGKGKLRERRIWARTVFKILRVRGLLKQFKGLLWEILRCLRIREMGANFRVALDDPADTGLLFALIGPATLIMNTYLPHQVEVQPSFSDEAVLEGYLYGTVRLWPIQLVAPLIRFTFSLATIRAVEILILSRWKRKK